MGGGPLVAVARDIFRHCGDHHFGLFAVTRTSIDRPRQPQSIADRDVAIISEKHKRHKYFLNHKIKQN